MIGTWKRAIACRLTAIASAWPRSSASMPGYAPAVSMKERIGRPNFSASSMTRSALRKPSGRGMPKLRRIFSLVSRPFWCPTIATGRPAKLAEAGDDGRVVGELPVAVELDEVGHEGLDVVEGVRAGRVAGDERLLPGGQARVDLAGDPVELLAKLLDLLAPCPASSGSAESSSIRRRRRVMGSSKWPFSGFTD